MKTLATTLLSLFSVTLLFAQVPTSAIESTELNVLYLGYENKVKVAVNDSESDKLALSGSNCTVAATDSPNEYIVKVLKGDKATLSISSIAPDGTTTLVRKQEYRIIPLPKVSIYWGNAQAGEKASLNDKELRVKYVSGVPFEANFLITKWDITSDFGNADGLGSDLTAATALFEAIDTQTTISMTLDVRGADGITRKIGATWVVAPLD
ncbi:MAG: hypothetical protein Crog4KO_04180 [Crocinitomicaceae bacterium]